VPPPSPAAPPPAEAATFGTIHLTIRPAGATVMIDGVRWQSSDAGQFVVQVPAGHHHIDVNEPGYTSFSHDLDVQPGQVTPLNVSLIRPT